MAEDTEGFPGVQVSTFILGDQYVFRGVDSEDFNARVKAFGETIEETLFSLNTVKQAVVAKGILTGDSGNGGTSKPAARGRSSGRAKDDAPPDDSDGDSNITYFEEDGTAYASVKCKHGHMLDLRDKGYKADLYCSLDTKDWKKKCKPVTV